VDLINDMLCSGEQLTCFDRTEIGKVGCVSAIDHPGVENVEVFDVDDGSGNKILLGQSEPSSSRSQFS